MYLYPTSATHSWLPHCGRKYGIKMATVSYEKPTFEGLSGLVMPLEHYTWASAGTCATLIVTVLGINTFKNGGTKKKEISTFILGVDFVLLPRAVPWNPWHLGAPTKLSSIY
ncbi:hypothetical protein Fcan01_27828 [Folsomia candida]|uniref:Uncharacterized protein n=1 Tax=Folsomia candida TaxID=158441 RepID=A0A226CWM4_FOLCA|nr:hypothetical protein Fcan01_27828 [Folsomia candida]